MKQRYQETRHTVRDVKCASAMLVRGYPVAPEPVTRSKDKGRDIITVHFLPVGTYMDAQGVQIHIREAINEYRHPVHKETIWMQDAFNARQFLLDNFVHEKVKPLTVLPIGSWGTDSLVMASALHAGRNACMGFKDRRFYFTEMAKIERDTATATCRYNWAYTALRQLDLLMALVREQSELREFRHNKRLLHIKADAPDEIVRRNLAILYQ